jgi:DNA polymerase (family 10)
MPSNYTIAKELKRVAYYREICDEDPANYPDAAWIVQSFSGGRLDELYKTEGRKILERTNELSDEVMDTIVELIEGKEVSALEEHQGVPLTVLELVEIRGVGAKMARGLFRQLGVADLPGLRAVIADGQISKVKGFGAKTIEKLKAFLDDKGI